MAAHFTCIRLRTELGQLNGELMVVTIDREVYRGRTSYAYRVRHGRHGGSTCSGTSPTFWLAEDRANDYIEHMRYPRGRAGYYRRSR